VGRLVDLIRKNCTLFQLALDFTSLEDTLKLVRKVMEYPIDIYEIGTPLLKAEGIKAIKVLRSLVGEEPIIVADTKTADTGALEAELAIGAGADAVTVLAAADNEVILEALSKAYSINGDVIVDTIGRVDVMRRVGELTEIGVKIVNIHASISIQRSLGIRAIHFVDVVRSIKSRYPDLLISVSGGIKVEDIRKFIEANASIIVVGSAITRSRDPKVVTYKFMRELGRV